MALSMKKILFLSLMVMAMGRQIALLLTGGLMLQGCTEQNITLLADPQVIATSIVENHEPLVDLKNQTIITYGPSPEIPNNTDYTKMRKTVYEKLIQAQSLLPEINFVSMKDIGAWLQKSSLTAAI
jgi:hypothetical protein